MPQGDAGLSHREDLGMGGGIAVGFPPIKSPPDDLRCGIVNDDAADRHLAHCLGLPGKLNRGQHIGTGIRRRAHCTGTTRVTSGTRSRRLRSMPM